MRAPERRLLGEGAKGRQEEEVILWRLRNLPGKSRGSSSSRGAGGSGTTEREREAQQTAGADTKKKKKKKKMRAVAPRAPHARRGQEEQE